MKWTKEYKAAYMKEYLKKYYKTHPVCPLKAKHRKLKSKFGITLEQYNIMFKEQLGCCAICGTHQITLNKSLAVDHNHSTGKVRKLLCPKCNMALGYTKEDIVILTNMIDYIKHFE